MYVQLKRHHNALAPEVSRYDVTDEAWAGLVLDAMNDSEQHFYVAERDGKPIAFLRLFYEQKAFGLACEVETLVVDESSRRAGIGDELMSHAETVARESGAKAIRVNVFSVNADGRRFYEERGYRMVAARYGKDL